MPSPVCSVLILARNSAEQLPAALSSVAMQRCQGIETIVVDDGSSDGTAAWLSKLASEWSGFRFIQTDGVGPAKARNAGIEQASAPVVGFLDADDWWWPNKLKAQLAFHAAHPKTAFSFTDYLEVSQDGEGRGTCFEHWQCPIRLRETSDYLGIGDDLNLKPYFVGTSTVLANKAALEEAGGFGGPVSAEGGDLWLRLAAHSPIACSKSISTSYLVRGDSAALTSDEITGPGRPRAELVQAASDASAVVRRPLPPLRLGKAATASLLSAARYFIGRRPASDAEASRLCLLIAGSHSALPCLSRERK
jgi:glycosyltransferase involved in cell wall biosynthesis